MTTILNYLKNNHPENSIDIYLVLYFLFMFGLERKRDFVSFVLSLQGFDNSADVEKQKPRMKVILSLSYTFTNFQFFSLLLLFMGLKQRSLSCSGVAKNVVWGVVQFDIFA